jgi:hypothetical protein
VLFILRQYLQVAKTQRRRYQQVTCNRYTNPKELGKVVSSITYLS